MNGWIPVKVTLIYTVLCGGPIVGRKVYDPWPFEMLPRKGEDIFLGDGDGSGQMFTAERMIWSPDEGNVEISCYDPGLIGPVFGPALERWAALTLAKWRDVGFDFGPKRRWEKEHVPGD